ncbi:unnamed protein product, partial [Musa acuminata subsp. burmannicoides]
SYQPSKCFYHINFGTIGKILISHMKLNNIAQHILATLFNRPKTLFTYVSGGLVRSFRFV